MTVLTDQERIANLEHVVMALVSVLHNAALLEGKDAAELIREIVPDYGKPQKDVRP